MTDEWREVLLLLKGQQDFAEGSVGEASRGVARVRPSALTSTQSDVLHTAQHLWPTLPLTG